MKTEMTERQRDVYEFIDTYCREHGYSPSYREIMEGIGVQNVNSISQHVAALRKKGLISNLPGRFRTLRIVEGTSC